MINLTIYLNSIILVKTMIKPELAKKFEDPRLDKLHNLIKSLYDAEFFKSKFRDSVLELTSLLERKIIDQETYNGCIHAIKSLAVVYINKTDDPEPLMYCCSVCGRYFLEKDEKFLKTEIKIKYDLKYSHNGICSDGCFKELEETLRKLDAGKY